MIMQKYYLLYCPFFPYYRFPFLIRIYKFFIFKSMFFSNLLKHLAMKVYCLVLFALFNLQKYYEVEHLQFFYWLMKNHVQLKQEYIIDTTFIIHLNVFEFWLYSKALLKKYTESYHIQSKNIYSLYFYYTWSWSTNSLRYKWMIKRS